MPSEVIDIEPTTAALAVYEGTSALVEPAASLVDIKRAFVNYQALVRDLLNDSDYQSLGKTRFVKKSGWRKLAVAFGVSCELISREINRDDDGNIRRAEIVVRATAPNGRTMDGLGICHVNERKFSKLEHDIPATAMTRATNRACSDLFGFGDVSAEEMQAETQEEDAMESWRPASKERVALVATYVTDTPKPFREWVKENFSWPWSDESCDQIEAAMAAQSVPGAESGEPLPLEGDVVSQQPAPAAPDDVSISPPAPGTSEDEEPM